MKEISLEQLIAGAILRFESVDQSDIKLLIDELRQHNIIVKQGTKNSFLTGYIKSRNGVYSLKDGYTKNTIIADDYTLAHEMENVASTDLLDILFNMDIDLFTLKKIRSLKQAKVEDKKSSFNEREQRSIQNLLDVNFIAKVWEGLAIYDEEQVFSITKKGEVRLFMAENPEIMSSLYEAFHAFRYNTELIPEFLATHNLENFTLSAETLIDFEIFCSIYDRDSRSSQQL